MTRWQAVIQLWTDPRIGVLTFVIFGAIVGCAVGEWREHHR